MKTIVYVSCAESGSVEALSLDEDHGALAPLQSLALGGQIMPLAVRGDGRVLLAARRSDSMACVSLAIDAASGLLSPLGETPLPASMPYLTLQPSGRWLLAASYQSGLLAVAALDARGQAQTVHQVVESGPKTHSVQISRNGRHALACVLGSDQFQRYAWDASNGRLGDCERLPMPTGSGPRHLALSADGALAYVLGELDGSVSVVLLKGPQLELLQTVSALPAGFGATPWAADLRLHPNGRWLYASERTGSTLARLTVGGDGLLADAITTVPTQTQPRSFAITASGRWLVCAGQRSNALGVHRIDPNDGSLSFAGEQSVGSDPNWVETLTLP